MNEPLQDMDILEKCPLCRGDLATFSRADFPTYPVDCQSCGRYDIHFEIAIPLNRGPQNLGMPMHIISGFTREQSIRGTPVTIDGSVIENLSSSGLIPKSPSEQVDRLLLNMARMTKHPGHPVHLNKQTDHTVAFAQSWLETDFYIAQLIEDHYLKTRDIISLKGWQRVAELQRSSLESRSAFIAMSFDPVMNPAYMQIDDAITRAGYEPIRVDNTAERKLGRIDDLIVSEIRRCRFVVAEFTGQKGGVYFEAGFALGLGIPVIWCCRGDEVRANKLHFDTRQFGHIVWDNESELSEKLYNKIMAVIV